MERCLFPARLGIFPLYIKRFKIFSPLCTLTWRANNYVYHQGKAIRKRNDGTNNRIINSTVCYQSYFVRIFIDKLTKFRFSKLELVNNKLFQSSTVFHNFPFKMATVRNKRKLAALLEIIRMSLLRTVSHETWPSLELTRITSPKCWRR